MRRTFSHFLNQTVFQCYFISTTDTTKCEVRLLLTACSGASASFSPSRSLVLHRLQLSFLISVWVPCVHTALQCPALLQSPFTRAQWEQPELAFSTVFIRSKTRFTFLTVLFISISSAKLNNWNTPVYTAGTPNSPVTYDFEGDHNTSINHTCL